MNAMGKTMIAVESENDRMDEKHQIISFGKYKGQPVDVLRTDPEYCEWLVGQKWFTQRYPSINTLIVNQFGLPEDTPVHNELQALFLDEMLVRKIIGQMIDLPYLKKRIQEFFSAVYNSCQDRFDKSVDGIRCNRRWSDSKRMQPGELCLCEAAIQSAAEVQMEGMEFECGGWDVRIKAHVRYGLYEEGKDLPITIYVEIKPELGDTYPSVLRQMIANGAEKTTKENTFYVLAFNTFTATNVSYGQVCSIFENSGIHVIRIENDETENAQSTEVDSLAEINETYRKIAVALIRQLRKFTDDENAIMEALSEECGWDMSLSKIIIAKFMEKM